MTDLLLLGELFFTSGLINAVKTDNIDPMPWYVSHVQPPVSTESAN